MLVIISCGKAKRTHRCQAKEMYVGSFHRACQRYTRFRWPTARWLILSAKYGLLEPEEEIEPYELRLGQPGSICADDIRSQAKTKNLLEENLIILGGRDYCTLCRHIWPSAVSLLEGIGGIGKQLRWLKERMAFRENHS